MSSNSSVSDFPLPASSLSARLREGTKAAHTAAERTDFIRRFLQGHIEAEPYRKLLAGLYHVYSALEEQLEKHRSHPILSQIYFPALRRKQSLEQDLSYFDGSDHFRKPSASPMAERYAARIRELGKHAPELLVAHCYTRYLGDLSGGQILKGIAQQALKLPTDAGLAFYDFPHIADHGAFKESYRSRLDQLPFDETMIARIVDEANAAFQLNVALFEELAEPAGYR